MSGFGTSSISESGVSEIPSGLRSETELQNEVKISESASGQSLAVFWHPACVEHKVPHHPEQPARASFMLEALQAEEWPNSGKSEAIFREAPRGTDEHVLLYHTEKHLAGFKSKCSKAEAFYRNKKKTNFIAYDSDTQVMWGTGEASFRACGAMIAAVDSVFLPSDDPAHVDTAYCCTRPPGHHAERGVAQGFCFFNNAAIGARYCQNRYGASHGIKKVAVLDFDVHHGNGTEEGFIHDDTLFYGSTHEKDNYPGTGTDPSPHVGERAKRAVDRRIVNRYLIGGDGDRPNPNKSSRAQFRLKWREVVTEMVRFRPDFVVFSAGFDAHSEDPLGNCWLEDEDFHWATRIVVDALAQLDAEDNDTTDSNTDHERSSSSIHCRRYVSILEGGYDLDAIASSAVQHVRALLGMPCTAVTPEDAAPLGDDEEEEEKEETERAAGDEVAALQETLRDMGL
jgi:acetoin utilization deacetylase AcuC-like enzyme